MTAPHRIADSVEVEGPLVRHVLPPGAHLWDEIREAWAELESTHPNSAFLSSTWVATWLDHFGTDVGAFAIIWMTSGGRFAGCALVGTGRGRFGPFSVRRAYLNASGVGPMPEHNDLLVAPEHRDWVLDDYCRVMLALGLDELALVGVTKQLREDTRKRWPNARWNGHRSESPFVDLNRVRQSGREYLTFLSSNTSSQLRRSLRLFEDEFGSPRLDVAHAGSEASDLLHELARLHQEVWVNRGQSGAFGPRVIRFHEDLLERAARSPNLTPELVRLRFGDRTVGMLYHLVRNGRVSFYQSGFTYADDRRLKPGLTTHFYSIRNCLERERAEYDFLGGEPASVRYKRSLSTDTRELWWVQLPVPSVKMRLLHRLRAASRPLRRSSRQRLPLRFD